MKKTFKKVPAFVIVSLIVLITVALAVFASNVVYDYDGDNDIDNNDVVIFMESLVGLNKDTTLSDLNNDGVVNVLDAITLRRQVLTGVADGWTIGIY